MKFGMKVIPLWDTLPQEYNMTKLYTSTSFIQRYSARKPWHTPL